MAFFNTNDPDDRKRMRSVMGPGQVDQHLRQTMQMCWMMLPDNKRTVDEVEKQIGRLLKRAIEDMREDADTFLGE
jgi:hypothetical protein